MNWLIIDKIILEALGEDIPADDITTNAVINADSIAKIDLIAKETGILAGLEIFERVFYLLGDVKIDFYKKDGDKVGPKMLIGILNGNTRKLLMGERVALNFLQRMSGIATITQKYVNQLASTSAKILDTRKTTPNMRILEKYSVKVGGGENHRFNLSDGVLLKDNHISAAGGIKNAVEATRKAVSFVRKIEVEVENLEMVKEALDAKADIIMLDNMNIDTMKEALALINKTVLTEASGNMNLETIKDIAEIGIDYISVGALTHSAKVLDLSMKNLRY
jgi:nicotinate-nucleotide pyrophosphorylase (carboxylating)